MFKSLFCIFCVFVGIAFSHPHVFIHARVDLIFDENEFVGVQNRTLLEDTESAELLVKALEEGEINFEQYATSMQLWYSSQMELLESERDCHVLLSELEAFKQ